MPYFHYLFADNVQAGVRRERGEEIWSQTGGEIDAFVTYVGSGGTFVGTSRALPFPAVAVSTASSLSLLVIIAFIGTMA